MLNLKNTLDGYLKNVEVIGNTVQDTNNLADIRSVGDKVEGQELYKIDVVSCGKNLFNKNNLNMIPTNCNVENNGGVLTITPHAYNTFNYAVALNIGTIKSGNYFYTGQKSNSTQFRTGGRTGEIVVNLGNETNKLINLTEDIDCILLNFAKISSGVITFDLNSIQIEPGTQATPYEPYQEQKLEILSPVQLEKVGDVADRIIEKNGVWGVEKNIKTYIFNGTENIKFWNGTIDQPNTCAFFCEQIFEDAYIDHLKINSISNIFTSYINATELNHVDKEGFSANSTVYFRCLKSNGSTVDEFKKYIKNLYIKYQTTNPTFIPLPHDQQIKLRTFAGQTNIAFLTEIPGQIKAQVPKSLGATVNTHTEQIADLHNSLDRVKKLEETTVSTIETESNFTTVDATSNGYFEGVKLEGKTLVNYIGNFNNWRNLGGTTVSSDGSVATVDANKWNCGLELCKEFNEGEYYFRLDNKNNATVVIENIDADRRLYAGANSIIEIKINLDSKTNLRFVIKNTAEVAIYEISNPLLVTDKGQKTYFEGLLSVGQDVEEISVASCDFIDITEFESGGFNGEGYPVENGARVRTSNYIPYANTKLKLGMLGSQEAEIVFYNKDKTKLSNIAWVKDGDIVAVPNNTQYVRVALRYPNDVVIYPSDIKYFKMSCPKDKKPLLYYNPTTETWEKPVLREWDTIEKHSDGKYYYHKRSGEVVFNDKSTNVNCWSNNPGDVVGFYWYSHHVVNDVPKTNGLVINNLLPNNVGGHYSTVEGFKYTSYFAGSIHKDKLGVTDVNDYTTCKSKILEYLGKNNITVVYQLEQEEVYECTNIDLMTYSVETNYIINSGAIPPKSTLKVHNNISNVVKILQEKVSLLENTFIAGLKSVLSGDMYSLATILYPEDFEQNDNTEQDIMVIPE